jgi:o-succinylbenzoate synthase
MYQARLKEHTLRFKTPAGTSRGMLHNKKSWFLILESNNLSGIGECSPFPGLSPDDNPDYPGVLKDLCRFINDGNHPGNFDLFSFPSIRFGLETAMLDLKNGGRRIICPSEFTSGTRSIPINGLIWMGNREFMEKQIKEKIHSGYTCLKLKIGAIDFRTEIDLLKNLRKAYPEIEIRLDANGAFKPDEALNKLNELSKFSIHSIEQPIKRGQLQQLAGICNESPIPVALDEELIGMMDVRQRRELIGQIKPAYIILKPGLLGGFESCKEWISIAGEHGTGWWVTSALESNIGLNAIAQWAATLDNEMVQGLGTGQLYENNFSSPLHIRNARLSYLPGMEWDLSQIIP